MLGKLTNWISKRREYGKLVSAMNFHWSEQRYIAIDMETTGLNVKTDKILSIGWVQLKHGAIRLTTARHMLLKGTDVDTASIGIHLITDSDIRRKGVQPEKVLKVLHAAFNESILIAHHAPIEIGFLKKIWEGLGMPETRIRIIDTMELENKLLTRRSQVGGQNSLRLSTCRARYGLPDYSAHDALTDALGTGELLMAQANHLGANTSLETLFRLAGKDVLLTSDTD